MNKKTKSNSNNISTLLILAAGLLLAFSPALLRASGVEVYKFGISRFDELITLLLSIIGGGTFIWTALHLFPNRKSVWAKAPVFLVGVSIAVLAWYVNVFSIFAF